MLHLSGAFLYTRKYQIMSGVHKCNQRLPPSLKARHKPGFLTLAEKVPDFCTNVVAAATFSQEER